jgi:hypothetical protein
VLRLVMSVSCRLLVTVGHPEFAGVQCARRQKNRREKIAAAMQALRVVSFCFVRYDGKLRRRRAAVARYERKPEARTLR